MIFGDKEKDIIEYLQILYEAGLQRVAIFPMPVSKNSKVENIVDKVCNMKEWVNWIDSSGKSAPPPDFYSDKYELMMDVMRVNDHEQKGKKGKLHNPTMAHERGMYKELVKSGVVKLSPNAKVFPIGNTKLPTYADHNYNLYLKCFRRVISKHVDSIPLYRKNHPGYKVIFLVFDESTAYFESDVIIDTKKQYKKGDGFVGRPHLFYLDEAFLNVFINKGIDYLFWYTPYKMFEYIFPPLELPNLCVYDLSKKDVKSIKYDVCKMTSVEM